MRRHRVQLLAWWSRSVPGLMQEGRAGCTLLRFMALAALARMHDGGASACTLVVG